MSALNYKDETKRVGLVHNVSVDQQVISELTLNYKEETKRVGLVYNVSVDQQVSVS